MISGVLKEEAQETCAGTEVSVGNAKIGAVEATLGGVGGVVARVAEPRYAKLRDQGGRVEERNLLSKNFQVGDTHLAEGVPKEHGGQWADLVCQLHGAFVALLSECINVASFLRERCGLEAEPGIAESIGIGVSEQGAALEGAAAQLERKRVGAAGQIEFADF